MMLIKWSHRRGTAIIFDWWWRPTHNTGIQTREITLIKPAIATHALICTVVSLNCGSRREPAFFLLFSSSNSSSSSSIPSPRHWFNNSSTPVRPDNNNNARPTPRCAVFNTISPTLTVCGPTPSGLLWPSDLALLHYRNLSLVPQ